MSLSSESDVIRLHQNQLLSEKISKILILSVKIIFFPITLLVYPIFKALSEFVSRNCFGPKRDVKYVDENKRRTLTDRLHGENIKFGFHNKAILEGMFFQANMQTPNTKTILLCTGSHNSYEHYVIPMVESFKAMNHNVMVFNYEGFGKSEGERSEQSVYTSVEAAYQYLKTAKKCSDETIVGWGYSLGSGAVCELASRHNVNVVVDRGFSSASEVAYHEAPYGLKTIIKILFFFIAHFNNLSKLKKAKGKILIVQGTLDTKMHAKEQYKKLLRQRPHQPIQYEELEVDHYHTDTDLWFSSSNTQGYGLAKNFLD